MEANITRTNRNERIDKVIDAIRRAKVFSWGNFDNCVMSIAFKRVLKRKYVKPGFYGDSKFTIKPVSDYLGITEKEGTALYYGYRETRSWDYNSKEEAISQLEALKI